MVASAAAGGPHQPNLPVGHAEEDRALRSWRFWLVAVLVGIGAGLGAGALMTILHAVQHVAYGYRRGDFQTGVRQGPPWRRVVVLMGAGVVLGSAWVLLRRVGGPVRGLDEAVWEHEGRLRPLVTAANALLQIVAVGAGATLGREGAPKELGAGLASGLCDRAGLTHTQRRVLVACGAGAGMAAVYNVPLGGALFASEVLLGSLALPVVVPALSTAAVATGVSWLILPDRPTYHVGHLLLSASLTAWAVVVGLLAGLLGAALVLLVGWAKARATQGTRALGTIVVAFVAVGAVAIVLPEVLGNGKDVTQLALSGALGVPLVAAVVLVRPLATAACLRSGAVGGLFTPTLTVGALAGTLAGRACEAFLPHEPVACFALIGAAALLSGAMQSPVASVVLVVELTHSGLSLLVPIVLAAAGATALSRVLVPASLYTAAGWWRADHTSEPGRDDRGHRPR
ncbi:MAG: chloride channel protein [Actinomycetota bacterium]|nr:chloride channel protein [Actinomycetota bacterium]